MKTLVENTPEIEFYTLLKDWLPLIDGVTGYNFALAEVELNYGAFLLTEWKPERGDIRYWIPGGGRRHSAQMCTQERHAEDIEDLEARWAMLLP